MDDNSSSDEEDAFSAMSKANAKRRKTGGSSASTTAAVTTAAKIPKTEKMVVPAPKVNMPISLTSSMKRHHKPSDARKAKMDALLQELEVEKSKIREPHRFVPDKKGSFVDPSEEHRTTNVFVGNLAPSVTEYVTIHCFLFCLSSCTILNHVPVPGKI